MTKHTENSSYRERLIEHLFVAELLKLSWLHYGCSLEIAKPEVDNSGYDLIAEANGIVRHIQLKSSILGSKTALQKIHVRLAEKPSGCVVWIFFDEETMLFNAFRYLGSAAGKQLSNLGGKVAKHTRGNKDGFKAERPNIRVVPKSAFVHVETIEEIYTQLFIRK